MNGLITSLVVPIPLKLIPLIPLARRVRARILVRFDEAPVVLTVPSKTVAQRVALTQILASSEIMVGRLTISNIDALTTTRPQTNAIC